MLEITTTDSENIVVHTNQHTYRLYEGKYYKDGFEIPSAEFHRELRKAIVYLHDYFVRGNRNNDN